MQRKLLCFCVMFYMLIKLDFEHVDYRLQEKTQYLNIRRVFLRF